jgi:hypothetical protein
MWTLLTYEQHYFKKNMIHSSEISHSQDNISKPPRKLEKLQWQFERSLLIRNSCQLSHTYYHFTVIKNTLWLLQTTLTVNAANFSMTLLVLVTKCMAYEFSYRVFCIRHPNVRMLLYESFCVKIAISQYAQLETVTSLWAL